MNQKGAVIIFVAIAMTVFIGVCALALDLSHLYLVRNELQNAADAGALAGVRFLYNPDGFVNPLANVIARNAAISSDNGDVIANKADKIDVEVLASEVERGHWSFADRTFTPRDSLLPVTLAPPYSFSDLDTNPDFVNAIRIVTRRGGGPENIPASSFFARFWGYLGFNLQAKAIAYIGFSQAVEPETVDKPIAICVQAVAPDYSCVTGRMINSSGSGPDTNTGGWTNYSQGSDCNTPNASEMTDILGGCGGSNANYLLIGSTVGLTNGMQTVTFDRFRDCWKQGSYDANGDNIPETPIPLDSRGYPTQPWRIKLPLVDCGNGLGPLVGCTSDVQVLGTIEVEVLWISKSGADPNYTDIPSQMEDWSCLDTSTTESRMSCWNSFTDRFGLKNYDQGIGSPTPYWQKSIYVKPTCNPFVGPTSGAAFNFFWKNPVLVD